MHALPRAYNVSGSGASWCLGGYTGKQIGQKGRLTLTVAFRLLLTIKDFERLGCVGNPHNHESLFGVRWSGTVAILDVDFRISQFLRNARELSRLVAAVDDQDIVFDDERSMFLKNVQSAPIIDNYQSDYRMVHRVACGNRIDVNPCFGQRIRETSK